MCKEKEMTHGLSFSNINLILYLLLEYRDTLTTPFRALLRSTLMNSRVYETVISLCDSMIPHIHATATQFTAPSRTRAPPPPPPRRRANMCKPMAAKRSSARLRLLVMLARVR